MSLPKWMTVMALALAVASAAIAQGSPSASVQDDLPIGGPVRPGTIEPAPDAETAHTPAPADPHAGGAPDPAAAPAVSEAPSAAAPDPAAAPAVSEAPSAAAPATPEKPSTPEMAHTGFEMVPWMLGSAAIVMMGVALLFWARSARSRG